MKEFPTLYQKAMTGKVKHWTVTVFETEDGYGKITKTYGQVDGKLQVNDKYIKKGKNIGRSNETSPYEQACMEAESAMNKKVDEGYVKDPSGESNKILPMKAQTFSKSGHRIKYPAFVQPKLNGVRCLVTCKKNNNGFFCIEYRSKKGKSYNAALGHLNEPLLRIMSEGDTFDGEIYVHGWTFQEIIRCVKKYRPGKSELLQFWAYDKVEKKTRYIHRLGDLMKKIPRLERIDTDKIQLLTTAKISKPSLVKKYHDAFVDKGFEGLIIRNADGFYGIGQRTADLQKHKEFIDHEFEIIGGRAAEGEHEGCVIFRVRGAAIDDRRNQGPIVEFDVVPKGSLYLRREWFNNLDDLIGKELTVRYHELSEDGIPVPNPVGITIRDYE